VPRLRSSEDHDDDDDDDELPTRFYELKPDKA
jgi:hypothetical protein